MNNSLKEIRSAIEKSTRVAVTGHINPDGDAVGAAIGLALSLSSAGKEVKVYLEDFPETYSVIPGLDKIDNEGFSEFKPDLFIAVDCAEIKRLEPVRGLFKECPVNINIDHHATNTYFGRLNYVESDASSASEIIFKLLDGFLPIPKDAATALYAGIVYDSGGFRHNSTTPLTMKIAAELMDYGFDFSGIYNALLYTRSSLETKLLGIAIEHMSMLFGAKVAISYITYDELTKFGASSRDVSEISGFLKTIAGTDVTIFIHEKSSNECKVSIRTGNKINATKIVLPFDGGGHERASGCTIKGTFETAMTLILAEVSREMGLYDWMEL